MSGQSFAQAVKTELCAVSGGQCCKWAQCYGMLLFSAQFRPDGIRLSAEHTGAVSLLARLLHELFAVDASVQAAGDTQRVYTLTVDDAGDCARVFEAMGHSARDVALRINRANIEGDCCAGAFLRGAFLASGFVTDPQKGYHIEILTPFLHLSRDLATLMGELELPAGAARRGGARAVYIKDSGLIEDMLFTMGAGATAFDFGSARVYKDMRNKANRVTNCETANLGKSIAAAERHIAAIKKLEQAGRLKALPLDLRQLAGIRLQNPYAPLSELGRAMNPQMGKSEVNTRLKRLLMLADEL